jgi:hypothetical protein
VIKMAWIVVALDEVLKVDVRKSITTRESMNAPGRPTTPLLGSISDGTKYPSSGRMDDLAQKRHRIQVGSHGKPREDGSVKIRLMNICMHGRFRQPPTKAPNHRDQHVGAC